MTLRKTLGLWVALCILFGVAVLTYRSIETAADTLGMVEHTHGVIRQLADVAASYARSTSARRKYLVADDGSELGDVAEADARLRQDLATLRGLVGDNAGQAQRADELGSLMERRLAGLDGAVARRHEDKVSGETPDGLALTDAVRTVRTQMESEENRLLVERYARTRRDITRTKITEAVGLGVGFALLLSVFHRLRQENRARRKYEQELRAANLFLHSIVENIPDMIFVKEAGELRFERINRAGEKLLGLPRQDLLGKTDYDFFPKEQADFFVERDRETLASKEVVDIAEEPIAAASGERWLHTRKVPIVDEHGVPRYLLGISSDITEQRQVAEALRKAKEAAEAANGELEAFSYSVAHDLRAPLRAIDGFSLALEEDCGDKIGPLGHEHLARVRNAAQQMGLLIDGLLGLSRVTRGEIVRERLSLTKMARDSAARLREIHPERKIEVVVEDGLVGEGDSRLLTSALDNLIGNAWKFTSKRNDARVEIGHKITEGRDIFFVRDNGAGFDPAYAHKLFGAFQRLHGAAEFEGAGIGLATVQRIVRRHGGQIWAESQVGAGATFYFTLGSGQPRMST